ncbi:MAG: serine hydrolase [Chitinophagaceae bacterium]|nr:serine hydrolase [Chitinophagaceae bacterium]
MKNQIPFLWVLFLIAGCSSSKQIHSRHNIKTNNAFLENLLKKYPLYFDTILNNRDSFRVQILYSGIDRDKNNKAIFSHHYFNVDPHHYFYPASTIKMPIAAAALEKLQKIKKYGIDRNTTMLTEAGYSGQTPVYNDPTTPDGRPTVAHYIKKIFLNSDNDASNRLYEFVGQQYLNKRLHNKGYNTAQIIHRLSIDLNEDQNRHTNPIKFFNDSGEIAFKQDEKTSTRKFPARNILLGNGYLSNNKMIALPFDFSKKNQIALTDLQSILQSILFPSSVPARQRFSFSDTDRKFIIQYLSQYPSETFYPQYDSVVWDGNAKFFLWDAEKRALPKNIRVFNKIGGAYGFLTDVAYVADFERNIEFMLSATIYCNSDGIFNDDRYDYENIGLPFMKHLAEIIHNYEITRFRKHAPDLTEFKIKYEK